MFPNPAPFSVKRLVGHPLDPRLHPLHDPAATKPGEFAVVVVPDSPDQLIEAVTDLVKGAPWLPLCLTVTHRTSRVRATAALALERCEHLRPAVLRCPELPALRQPLVLDALYRRPVPSIAQLAAWFTSRWGRPELWSLLQEAMAPRPAAEAAATDRRIRRALGGLGPLTRHEWQRLARLAQLPRIGLPTTDARAGAFGTEPRTYRAWIRRLLGVSRLSYELLPGWEPVLELTIRKQWGAGQENQAVDVAEQ
jgi:hypothetical protein